MNVLLLEISFIVDHPGTKSLFAVDKVSADVFKFIPRLDKAPQSGMELGFYA